MYVGVLECSVFHTQHIFLYVVDKIARVFLFTTYIYKWNFWTSGGIGKAEADQRSSAYLLMVFLVTAKSTASDQPMCRDMSFKG